MTAAPALRAMIWLCALLAALLLALAVARVLAWQDHAPVEGWMTPRFVSMAYGLPEAVLGTLLGADGMRPNRTLARIAADAGGDPQALVASVEAAVLAHRGAPA